jgi:hypothetical protein
MTNEVSLGLLSAALHTTALMLSQHVLNELAAVYGV